MLYSLALTLALASPSASPAQRADSLRPDGEVRLVALRHAIEIQRCYETQGLRLNAALGGMIEVEVTVLPSGRVESANVASSALQGLGRDEVEACITTVVKNWRFEKGPFATETIVYPFNLVRERGTVVNTIRSS